MVVGLTGRLDVDLDVAHNDELAGQHGLAAGANEDVAFLARALASADCIKTDPRQTRSLKERGALRDGLAPACRLKQYGAVAH
jgi:hypothetical protein